MQIPAATLKAISNTTIAGARSAAQAPAFSAIATEATKATGNGSKFLGSEYLLGGIGWIYQHTIGYVGHAIGALSGFITNHVPLLGSLWGNTGGAAINFALKLLRIA